MNPCTMLRHAALQGFLLLKNNFLLKFDKFLLTFAFYSVMVCIKRRACCLLYPGTDPIYDQIRKGQRI